MRSIYACFKAQEKRDTGDIRHGAYIHLAGAVKGQGFSRKSLVKAFKDLMPKDEYLMDETKTLVDHLENLTNMPVAVEIRAKNLSEASGNTEADGVIIYPVSGVLCDNFA